MIDQEHFNDQLSLRLCCQSFGIVVSVYPGLIVRFVFYPSSLTNVNYLNKQKLFRLERLPNFVTLNRSIDALKTIVENSISLIIQPFLNLSENLDHDHLKNYAQERVRRLANSLADNREYNQANLNESQREAIRNALENRLTLIQGPPGTGKTETSAWIIHLWLNNFFQQDQPILVCAETHQAVDNLTRRLLPYQYRLVRYGEPRTIASDLHV